MHRSPDRTNCNKKYQNRKPLEISPDIVSAKPASAIDLNQSTLSPSCFTFYSVESFTVINSVTVYFKIRVDSPLSLEVLTGLPRS